MAIGRVRDRRTFRALRRSGRRARSGPVAVTALLDSKQQVGEAEVARVAFAVGRPVGPAVVRNRVRRRLRAAVRELDVAPGVYLIAASPEAVGAPYSELRGHLETAIGQATS
jgi:ribonuclease P protein component